MSRFRNKFVKRAMAVILSGAMVLSCMPSSNMTVFASETSVYTGGGGIEEPESVDENATEFTGEETGTESDEEEIKTEPVMEEIVAEDEKETATEDTKETVVKEQDDETEQNQAELAVQADEPASGTDWTLDTDGKLTITSDDGMTDWIEKSVDNKAQVITVEIQDGVTSIEENAFSGCSSLTGIEIPNSVTKIKKNAFKGCSGLTSIEIPNSVTSIGWSAFEGCIGLTDVEIPDSVTEIDISAFKDCVGLTSVKISNNVKRMGSVFQGCSSLTSITIPEGVTSIGGGTFNGCSSLTDVTLPESLETIQGSVFKGCSSLTSIEIPENVGEIWSNVFQDCIGLTSIEIPDKVNQIYPSTFEGCSNLKSIKMPDSARGIGTYAFKNCTSLMSITIPSNVTGIGANAFENCTSLTSVTVLPITPPSLDRHWAEEAAPDYPEEVFKGCKFVTDHVEGIGIYVPLGTEKAYQKAWTNWAYYIEPKLNITTQPTAPKDVQNGQEVTFFVAAEGKGTITYQWQVRKKDDQNFVDIEGETSTTYTISAVDMQTHNENTYRCKVTSDEVGSITSNEVLLTVRKSDAEKIAEAVPFAQTALDNYTAYNSTAASSIQFIVRNALSNAGIKDVGNQVTITEKQEATYAAAGYIKGTLTLTCGNEKSEPLVIDKTIAQLVKKVDAAEKIVNDTIAGLTVTNDTTHDSIQAEINAALINAGTAVTGVTATVKGIAKEPATVKDKGFISFNVEIECTAENDKKTIGPKILWIEVPDTDKVEAAKKVVEETIEGLTVTNHTTGEDIQAAIDKALKSYGTLGIAVTVTVGEITKTEATTAATGSISGTVTIACGSATDTVDFDKTIAKLTQLEAAKQVVEKTIEGLTVTNDTTKEDIQNAIDTALSEAEISDVTVTVGNITKTEATTDKAGSIRGKVTVKCGEATGTVDVNKVIAKLPEIADEDTQKAEKIIEDALKKITITNDTTKDDILDVLKEAFGDDATVGEIEVTEKTDATEDAPGSLSLKINVAINGKPIVVNITVPIEKIENIKNRTGVWVRFTDYDELGKDSKPCYKYTGTAVKPDVKVYNNETLLTLGEDYTIGYKNNIKVGTAELTVKGKGNFTGASNVVSFTIIKADIDKDTDHPTTMTVVAGTKVAPVIMNGTKQLTAKDYELSGAGLDKGKYASATADGTFNTLTVKGIDSYEGSSFNIQVRVIDKNAAQKLAVTIDKNFKPVYDGKALTLNDLFKGMENPNGVITVTDSKDKNKTLEQGQDYTVVCKSNLTNVGTVKFTVTGMGVYAGSVSKTFKINPLKVTDSSKFSVTFDENKVYEYKASGTVVDNLTVKYLGETASDTDDQILRQGVDYKVSYSNNKKVSDSKDAQLKITFLGNYKGSAPVSKTFQIKVAKMSATNTAVTVPDMVYSKADKAYKSTPIVTVDGV
ncbi:MAG: leucine-rich repeat domain-containing protein, partial [Lachnospiraceae bacterium]|nr:leucine-rich repeat domain-containing protein [Lachnospiraceae bacterium]